MGKKTNRFLSAVLALVMTASLALTVSAETAAAGVNDDTAVVEQVQNKPAFEKSGAADEIPDHGEWGDLNWYYNVGTKTLSIVGYGDMQGGISWYTGGYPWLEYYSEDIVNVNIDENVTSIAYGAFKRLHKLKNVTFGKNTKLKKIDSAAFYECDSLESISIPDTVTTMGYGVFCSCESLKNVTLSKKLTSIPQSAFFDCWSLESIAIPASVETIGIDAFLQCYSLKCVEFDPLAKRIILERCAFQNCSSLETVSFPDSPASNVTIGYQVFRGAGANELVLPSSVKSIEEEAFFYSGLKRIVIPDSIKTIQKSTFEQCSSLESVELPYGLEKICENAFCGCSSLHKVTILNPDTVLEEGSLSCVGSSNFTLYCTENSNAQAYAIENNIPYVIIGDPYQTEFTKLTPNKSTAYVGNTVVFTPELTTDPNMDLAEYTFKYTITKAGIPTTYNGTSAGKLSWKPNESGKYSVKCDIFYHSKKLASKTINYTVKDKALSVSVKVTPDGTIGVPDNATVKAAATGGKGPYQYRYVMNRFGTTTVIKNWSTSASVKKLIEQDGYYTFTVYVKDAAGTEVSAEASKTVNRCLVNIDINKTEGRTGEKVTITPSLNTPTSLIKAANYKFTITNGSTSTSHSITSGNSLVWTPAAAGSYNIKCDVVYNNKTYDSYSKALNVINPADDVVTIYYKGYTKPNICYKTAGGTWTAEPGAAMSSSFAVSGYPYKYTIKLNGAANAEVYFNNGNGNVDNNNGANYKFTRGIYTFSGGVITAIEKPALKAKLSVSKTTAPMNTSIKLTAAGESGTTPYTYYFAYTLNGKTTKIRDYATGKSCNFTPTEAGTYTFKTTVKDASGKTASATKKVTVKAPEITAVHTSADKITCGQSVDFTLDTANTYSGLTVSYRMENGNSTETYETALGETFTWTPESAGDYSIIVSLVNNGTEAVTTSLSYTVEEAPVPENTITIYYKGYANPNIHYQVGSGSWTNVPGVAMTATSEVPGYTHKYTIDLGSASYANVCFNDGNNNWDSNNGANYRFTKGTYKFSNGTITAM